MRIFKILIWSGVIELWKSSCLTKIASRNINQNILANLHREVTLPIMQYLILIKGYSFTNSWQKRSRGLHFLSQENIKLMKHYYCSATVWYIFKFENSLTIAPRSDRCSGALNNNLLKNNQSRIGINDYIAIFTKRLKFSQYSPPLSLAPPPFEILCTPLAIKMLRF